MNSPRAELPLADILIVDDTPDNLRLLSAMLTAQGYEVRKAINGTMALEVVRAALPDLILLDIMMPDISGYDVCSTLKADAQTREIPVIFISAIHKVSEKVKAFEVGGVDYITKPFQPEEVLARVQSQLSLRWLQKQLAEQNTWLQQEMRDRIRAEEALRQAEEKYRSIFENAVEGIFQTTPDGRYLSVNPALARMYGYSSPEELITHLTDIEKQLYVDPNQRAQFIAAMERCYCQGNAVCNFESEVYRKDGSIIWVSENARAVKDAQGNLLYYEGTVEDITDGISTLGVGDVRQVEPAISV